MNICIPVEEDNGFASSVCAHFGSAPFFMVVEAGSENCRVIANTSQQHAHGMCMPLKSLQGEPIDAMVVGGIGAGALSKLNAANISVYICEQKTVAGVVAAFKAGSLKPMQSSMVCAHHGHGNGHS